MARGAVASIYTAPKADSTNEQGRNQGLNVLFIGSDEFAGGILAGLLKHVRGQGSVINNLEVACARPKIRVGMASSGSVGRVPVETAALISKLRVHYTPTGQLYDWVVPRPKADPEAVFDIGVACTSSSILPKRAVDAFPLGVLQIHPSLLPRHRGPTAIQAAILGEDQETGVTVAEYSAEKRDSGRILAQVPYKLDETSTYREVQTALAHLGGKLIVKVLQHLDHVRSQAIPQDEDKASYTEAYEGDSHLKIVWETMTAAELSRMCRAFHGIQALHTIWRVENRMEKLQLLDLHLPARMVPPLNPMLGTRPPGSMFYAKKVPYLEVPCIDDNRIHVSRLLVEGKTEKLALEFVNGYLRETGMQRMLTKPVSQQKPTPDFVYPPGHRLFERSLALSAKRERRKRGPPAAKR
ncbi:Methionyl-tRNA formyltransferase [Coemansia biformis]|uniref:Methionyl-tRNA formyltransferase n=1 Tax=Coemansia biformis TaxID=1286918 RepID=A0A9W7YF70_9FUNG|nr:Methionyl-tRNA formyltransferase [Coemansia biformis]